VAGSPRARRFCAPDPAQTGLPSPLPHPTPEETNDPRRDLPIGILGSVLCVTILYTLMATTLVLMVPGKTLQSLAKASFAAVSGA
jgi:amino acid transporter